MAHELHRLSKSYLEEPQLCMASRFEEIADILTNTDRSELHKEYLAYQAEQAEVEVASSSIGLTETNIGVLRIEGALTNKPTMFGAMCGLTSYQELIEQTTELCSMDNINVISILANSGGGEAYNAFIAANQVKSLCKEHNKKLITYVDGVAGSACYAWASVADEIVMHPNSMVGSIGVVVRTVNTSEAEKKEGIKVEYHTFGAGKVPVDEDGKYTKEFKEDIQERVDELGASFITHVSENRGLPESFHEETGAKMFSAEKAIALGLADKIMTNEQFYEYLEQEAVSPEVKTTQPKPFRLESKENPISMENNMSVKETQEAIEASVDVGAEQLAELSAMKEQLAQFNEMKEQLSALQAEKQEAQLAAAKSEALEGLAKFSFLTEGKEELASFLSCSESSQEAKTLLNSVLDKAQASYEEVQTAAAEEIAQAQANADEAVKLAEEAEAKTNQVKEEFGETEHAVEAQTEALSHTEMLKLKVQEQKAARAAKAK